MSCLLPTVIFNHLLILFLVTEDLVVVMNIDK